MGKFGIVNVSAFMFWTRLVEHATLSMRRIEPFAKTPLGAVNLSYQCLKEGFDVLPICISVLHFFSMSCHDLCRFALPPERERFLFCHDLIVVMNILILLLQSML